PEEPEDLDEADLEDLADEDTDLEDVEDVDTGEEEGDEVEVPVAVVSDEEEGEEEEDDVDVDDVEASLDEILKEKLVVGDEDEDEDEVPDTEERSDASIKVLPKQPDEFVCQSCFLVKHPSQLADRGKMLCRDCV